MKIRRKDGRAFYSGLQSCGSISACPLCMAKIRRRRAFELAVMIRLHLEAGGGVLMGALTSPHDRFDSLKDLKAAQKAAWGGVLTGRAWMRVRGGFGIIGQVTTKEYTVGPNGWHPHYHVMVFTERPLSIEEADALQAAIYERWADGIQNAGFSRPAPQYCRFEAVRSVRDAAHYLAAMEMTRLDLKEGGRVARVLEDAPLRRTPLEVLASFRQTGDEADLQLWRDYEQATKRDHPIQFSPGLKARFGIKDLSDQQAAEEKRGGEDVFTFADSEFRAVLRLGKVSEVLDIAELEGGEAVAGYVARITGALEAPPVPVDGRSRSDQGLGTPGRDGVSEADFEGQGARTTESTGRCKYGKGSRLLVDGAGVYRPLALLGGDYSGGRGRGSSGPPRLCGQAGGSAVWATRPS